MNLIARQRLRCVCGDYVATVAAMTLYYVCHYELIPEPSGMSLLTYLLMPAVLTGIFLFPLAMLGFYWLCGTYRTVFVRSRVNDILGAMTAAVAGALAYFFIVLSNRTMQSASYSHELLLAMMLLLFVCLWVERSLVSMLVRRAVLGGGVTFPTLIVGTGKRAAALARRLGYEKSRRGIDIIGYVRCNRDPLDPEIAQSGLPLIELRELGDAVWRLGVRQVIFVPEGLSDSRSREVMEPLYALNLPVLMHADDCPGALRRPLADIKGEPLVDVVHPVMADHTACVKRALDVAVAAAGLVLTAPLMALTAVAIMLDSPGPAIYRQKRLGYRQRPFTMYKLRSMRTADNDETSHILASVDDPRVTRVGAFIRKYRIDELPQLWNVLRGEMSLVGPRPEQEYFARRILAQAPAYYRVYRVRPGITSWGMVRYGYVDTVPKMISRMKYDLIYLDNVTVSMDLKIIIHTISTVLSGRGR